MFHHPLGAHGPSVSALGLGCMGMSDFYGPADHAESIATIHAATEAGTTLLDTGDFPGVSPRFQGENLLANLALAERLRAVADGLSLPLAPVAIAWVRAQGEDITPLVGARSRMRLAEALRALDVTLLPEALAALAEAAPPGAASGARDPAEQLAHTDSER